MSRGLVLVVLDGHRVQRIEGVASLVAADASGEFGLQPGHADFVTVLEPGLLRWRVGAGDWQWAACTGGLLQCRRGQGASSVTLVTSRFVQDGPPEALQRSLDEALAREVELRVSARESQARLDTQLVKHLQRLAETAP